MDAVCHQRIIRDGMAAHDPVLGPRSLDGFMVETISRLDATPLILRYEWLGNLGRAQHFIGLISPTRYLCGVACFGYGPSGYIRKLIGDPAFCLERGACVHFAPPNAASFLINRACKLIHRLTGVERFFAYADPNAGEYGGVYQAAGWLYLGQGLNGGGGRKRRYFVLPPGADRDVPSNWSTTYVFRRHPGTRRMTWAQARKAGWEISEREAKHVYALHVGRARQAWRQGFKALPYPAPRPELKRVNLGGKDGGS